MKNSGPTPSWQLPFWGAVALMGLGVFATLYFFDPVTSGIYPVCPFHETTGLLCPGCGTTRAMHQLVHGNFAAAWGFNPLAVALVPAGAWLVARELIVLTTGRRLPGVITRPIFGWALLVVFVAFGILRNIPRIH